MGGDRAADVGQQLVAGRGHHRGQDRADEAEALGDVREAGIQTGAVGGVGGLGEFPRRPGLDVRVHRADEDPEGL